VAELLQATAAALSLLFSADPVLWHIVGLSFSVTLRAVVFSAPFAILVAFALALGRFRGRRTLISTFNALMSLPAVVVGLSVYLVLSRSGPLGSLGLLFTQPAMVIAQAILIFPLLVAMAHGALQGAERRAWETALTLGASRRRAMLTLLHEVRFGITAALIAGFGRAISEVGCSLMVGGNIRGYTRNIPTAIALETSKGEFAQGIALGLVLLLLALALNLSLGLVQGKGELR